MKLAWKLLTLFALGVAELWAAAPAGALMKPGPAPGLRWWRPPAPSAAARW